VGLVSSKSNFFINKISQGRKSFREKSTFSPTFAFIKTPFFFYEKMLVALCVKKKKRRQIVAQLAVQLSAAVALLYRSAASRAGLS
jgi:hypothetical protein